MPRKKPANKKQKTVSVDSLVEMIKAGNDGDEQALSTIDGILNGPDAHTLIEIYGDLTIQVEAALIRSASSEQPAFEKTLTMRLNLLRSELSAENASPLESLLVGRVVICWLQSMVADLREANAGMCSTSTLNYLAKQQDRAHRRFLSAVKTLAQVRKMALPIQLDVNANININETAKPKHNQGSRFNLMNSLN